MLEQRARFTNPNLIVRFTDLNASSFVLPGFLPRWGSVSFGHPPSLRFILFSQTVTLPQKKLEVSGYFFFFHFRRRLQQIYLYFTPWEVIYSARPNLHLPSRSYCRSGITAGNFLTWFCATLYLMADKVIRKLTSSGTYSRVISLPRNYLKFLKWRDKQNLEIELDEKGQRLIIKDAQTK